MGIHKAGKRRAEDVLSRRRRVRRRGLAAVIALATGGSLALVMVGPTASATAVTALQAVQVKLGADGSVTSITSNLVSKSSDSSLTSSSQQLSPSALGGRLPLRVLVAYQHNGKQGTNLNDLVGQSGQFVINLTVQNTSVKPALDTDQLGRQSYALTGTPLTVVASADLGDPNLAHVVMPSTASAGSASLPTTSGVLSTAANGDAQVLYSALLVPPALPASTTFTLVENSSKFVVPTVTIAAQPGVVTNPSASNLIQTAFGSSNNTQETRQNALVLVGNVSSSLESVLGTLATMTRELQQGSSNLTGPTLKTLRTSTSRLSSDLDGLSSLLTSTQNCLSGTVTASIDTPGAKASVADCQNTTLPKNVQTQLGTAVTNLQRLILGPSTSGSTLATSLGDAVQPLQFGLQGVSGTPLAQIVPGTVADACSPAVTSSVTTPNMSLLGQVKALQGWFSALQSANTLCARTLQDNIVHVIGTITSSSSCSPADTTLACRFFAAATNVGASVSDLAGALQSNINDVLPNSELTSLFNDVVLLRDSVSALADGQINTTTITNLQSSLKAVTDALSPNVDTVLNTANAEVAGLAPLVNGTGGNKALSDLPSAVATICATPSATPDATQTALTQYFSTLANACSPTGQQALTDQASAVVAALAQSYSDWQTVQGAAQDLSDDITKSGDVVDSLAQQIAALASPKVKGQGNGGLLQGLQQQIQQLISGLNGQGGIDDLPSATVDPTSTATPAEACGSSVSAPDGSVAKLFADFHDLYCNNHSLSTNLSSAINNFTASAAPVTSNLNQAGADTGNLGGTESARVTTFFANFNSALTAANLASTGSGNSLGRAGQANCSSPDLAHLDSAALDLSNCLTFQQNQVDGQLHGTAVQLLGNIVRVFDQALNGSPGGKSPQPGIKQARSTLTNGERQLTAALIGKNGLQSVLDGNNRNAQQAHDAVNSQVTSASAYTAVQSVASGQAYVTQQVLAQSLGSTLGAFGVQIPDGSQITSVYTFQLGGN